MYIFCNFLRNLIAAAMIEHWFVWGRECPCTIDWQTSILRQGKPCHAVPSVGCSLLVATRRRSTYVQIHCPCKAQCDEAAVAWWCVIADDGVTDWLAWLADSEGPQTRSHSLCATVRECREQNCILKIMFWTVHYTFPFSEPHYGIKRNADAGVKSIYCSVPWYFLNLY